MDVWVILLGLIMQHPQNYQGNPYMNQAVSSLGDRYDPFRKAWNPPPFTPVNQTPGTNTVGGGGFDAAGLLALAPAGLKFYEQLTGTPLLGGSSGAATGGAAQPASALPGTALAAGITGPAGAAFDAAAPAVAEGYGMAPPVEGYFGNAGIGGLGAAGAAGITAPAVAAAFNAAAPAVTAGYGTALGAGGYMGNVGISGATGASAGAGAGIGAVAGPAAIAAVAITIGQGIYGLVSGSKERTSNQNIYQESGGIALSQEALTTNATLGEGYMWQDPSGRTFFVTSQDAAPLIAKNNYGDVPEAKGQAITNAYELDANGQVIAEGRFTDGNRMGFSAEGFLQQPMLPVSEKPSNESLLTQATAAGWDVRDNTIDFAGSDFDLRPYREDK